jgi:1-acyl-sn-glycerol-3-phosphate acyltransferase
MFYHFLHTAILFLSKILLRCKVTGKDNVPKHGACIVVANHINLLDSPILGVSLGRKVYFMAKEELFDSRFMGWLFREFGAFPVGKGKLDRRAGRTALELINNEQAIIILPEGKRSEDGRLGYAYPGAALLAAKSRVSIIPVGISGTGRLVGKWWFLNRPRIQLNIGKPFTLPEFDGKLSKGIVSQLTYEIMSHIAALLSPESRGRYNIDMDAKVYLRSNASNRST